MLSAWCIVFLVVFFFFKQKTAYEMRISDWSSDVCSSDLESLTGLSNDQIRINVIGSGVGGITESDAQLAATSKATLIGFNVRADASARKVIEGNGVDLRYFSIIYDVIDQVK